MSRHVTNPREKLVGLKTDKFSDTVLFSVNIEAVPVGLNLVNVFVTGGGFGKDGGAVIQGEDEG